jgi:stress responsive alpha/beta barrel protein
MRPDRPGSGVPWPVLRHVVLFSFTPELDSGGRDAIALSLEDLVGVVPGLVSMRCGRDAGLVTDNAEFAVVADFTDTDAWRGYLDHPAHVAVASTQIRPFVTQRVAAQFQIEA